jgi:predicted nucleotidyltransferase
MTAASECLERARDWVTHDHRVAAALVYGSVAHGADDEFSDLDLVIVTRTGERDDVWEERKEIAGRLLHAAVAWGQEPVWQRAYRYQVWRHDLVEVDLTFDEGHVEPWQGLVAGFETLIDKDGVVERLRHDLAAWHRPEFNAPAFDGGTWMWLNWLDARLRREQLWVVRAGLFDTLNTRVLPLLGVAPYEAEQHLSESDLAAVTEAAPRSQNARELRRALRATAALYDQALDRWAARTRSTRPHHPLAAAIRRRLAE